MGEMESRDESKSKLVPNDWSPTGFKPTKAISLTADNLAMTRKSQTVMFEM
jgi:hypothetical protein